MIRSRDPRALLSLQAYLLGEKLFSVSTKKIFGLIQALTLLKLNFITCLPLLSKEGETKEVCNIQFKQS